MSAQLSMFDAEQAARDEAVWWSTAMTGIKTLAATGREFTTYEVSLLGVPEPVTHHRWGALTSAARKAGLIEFVRYAKSRRPGTKGSAAAVWRGTAKARTP